MGLGFESQADHDDLYIRHNVRFLRMIRFRIVRFFVSPFPPFRSSYLLIEIPDGRAAHPMLAFAREKRRL